MCMRGTASGAMTPPAKGLGKHMAQDVLAGMIANGYDLNGTVRLRGMGCIVCVSPNTILSGENLWP